MSVQNADIAFDFSKEIGLVEGLLVHSFLCELIDRGQFHDIVVVDVHTLGRLLLVLSRAIVVALVVVKFVRFRAWPLGGMGNVVRTLCGSQDASASIEREKNTSEKHAKHPFTQFSTSSDDSSSCRSCRLATLSARHTELCNFDISATRTSRLR